MDYEVSHNNGCDIIKLHNKFNAETVKDVKRYFNLCINESVGDVLIDMTQVDNIDSSGIGALVFLYKRLKSESRSLGLLGAQGKTSNILNMLRITETIKNYHNFNEYLGDHHH
jgi:anti-anti-sigma factor